MSSFQKALINAQKFYEHVNTLTVSQKHFVDVLQNWFDNRKNLFVVVSGGPGSGKTHTVVKTLQYVKCEKIFMAPTARLAQKIGGRTIHSQMRLNWGNGSALNNLEKDLQYVENIEECLEASVVLRDELQDPSPLIEIVVIDEVGMIPFWLLFRIVEKYFRPKQNCLVICMGDSCQLKPVTSNYNVFQVPFDAFFDTVSITMQESKRFTPDYKRVIDELRSLMEYLDEEKIFDFVKNTYPVVPELTEDMLLKANRVLAYKNLTVATCNEFYLNKIMCKEQLFKLYERKGDKINRENVTFLRKNCSVVVTENNCSAVSNGTSLTFLGYDKQQDAALCRDEFGRGIIVYRSQNSGKIPLTLGFAVTIHKFQGETIDEDNIVFSFDQCTDLHLVYTALSRVRSIHQISAVIL